MRRRLAIAFALALVLGLSFAPMVARALAAGLRPFLLGTLFAAGASAAYFGWHVLFELLAPTLNAGITTSTLKWTIVVSGLVVLFLAQSVLQLRPTEVRNIDVQQETGCSRALQGPRQEFPGSGTPNDLVT